VIATTAVAPGAAAKAGLQAPAGPERAAFADVLRARAAAAPAPAQPAPPGAHEPFARTALAALESIDAARRRLDAVVAQARSGRTFAAHELLAMQAEAYRFGQAVDVAARVAEQAAQAIRQAVNTQL
jgi:hypothetical protein